MKDYKKIEEVITKAEIIISIGIITILTLLPKVWWVTEVFYFTSIGLILAWVVAEEK
ncbi:MAG: hypothetical protein Q4A56_03540 [Porphyromonadaceae bacterium]|nr:hypothetical protein [Porphyromonadaceae bacterium]